MLELNRRVVKLAWALSGLGWLIAWGIDRWLEPVSPHALVILGVGTLLLVPATLLVRRLPARPGTWVAYFSLVSMITVANLAFDNPDLWNLFFTLGILRLVYRDSYLHLISPLLSVALYGVVLWLNPEHRAQLTTGQMLVRMFILLCFHAMGMVINMSVKDIRARPAKTAIRLVGQYAIKRLRSKRTSK